MKKALIIPFVLFSFKLAALPLKLQPSIGMGKVNGLAQMATATTTMF